jgi:hypothetical protein
VSFTSTNASSDCELLFVWRRVPAALKTGIDILPAKIFAERLWAGELF